jgi:predicted CXXCH cytochrome family protein
MRWRSRRALVISLALLALGGTAALLAFWQAPRPPVATTSPPVPPVAESPATFVDERSCLECHASQVQAWVGSHHDLAMQEATAATVLGDFADARFSKDGVQTRFFQRDGKFWVRTDGEDGRPADFEVKYTFGVEPLQQYLIQLDRGRLQAFTIVWDVARRRWFHLYPTERIDHRDPLHWTRPLQNWNFMCAECHSTDLKKNHDPRTASYNTAWRQIDVGCQACHGPASKHLSGTPGKGDFLVDLSAPDASLQIETCARCHSRRAVIADGYRHGERLMQTHQPSLLTPDLYFADGQIRDEVYEYGSFLQSKMHSKGVRCSDCHEPHSLRLRREGNELCAGCHNAGAPAARASIDTSGLQRKNYDSAAHHFHQPGQPGSKCVDCHAPSRVYMQVDARRDHSFRIPRPDLSVRFGTPNACNSCHERRPAQWAAKQVEKWYGPNRRQEVTFVAAFDAAQRGEPSALDALTALAGDVQSPAIVRATAVDWLRSFPGETAFNALQSALRDTDPLVRTAAANGFDVYDPRQRSALLPLLSDPIRAVRLAAIAAAPPERLNSSAVREYEMSQQENADQPGAHINVGNLYASLGRAEDAASAYQAAIRLDATSAPAYVNLADLRSRSGENAVAIEVLRTGLQAQAGAQNVQTAALHHALGLALVRERRYEDAIKELELSAKQSPNDARYAYVLGVALYDGGKRQEGLRVLKQALRRHPNDPDLANALAAYGSN